jgi:gliding motility-associated-like protein
MSQFYNTITSRSSYIIDFIQSQNVALDSLKFLAKRITLASFFLLAFVSLSHAQPCGPSTPSFNVNLTGNPNGTWISPPVVRQDLCCSAASNETCVEFVITLDPASQGIIFNIYSGAIPPGALYYQLNCGPVTAVGQPLCLTGVGPHIITFCKPGNNINEYSITAIPQTGVSGSITLNDGCSGSATAYGYDPSTITWSSVYPGAAGAYDSYLNCTAGCSTMTVTPAAGFPPYVDYQVCGVPAGGCTSSMVCEVVRIYYNPTLTNTFSPPNPSVCYGYTGTSVTATPSGGTPPYTYQWSNGSTAATVFLAPGTYTVAIGDTSSCPPLIDTVIVTGFTSPITASAGPDQTICVTSQNVQLNGAVTGVSTGIWSGGNGTYNPSNTSLNAAYTPSAAEIAAGQVTLTLTTTNNGSCPAASDAVTILLRSFQASIASNIAHVNCNGNANGSITLTVSGSNGPFTYSWNTNPAQYSSIATGLSGGSYTAVVTDANGCTGSITATVNEPAALSPSFTNISNVTCNGGNNGTITVQVTGGTAPYNYSWNTTPTQFSPTATSLSAGTYNVLVTDNNGCTINAFTSITEPAAIVTTAQGSSTICPGQQTLISASASGGNGNFSYNWQPSLGNASSHLVSPSSTTTYNVTAVDNFGCAGNTATVTVTVMTLSAQNLSVSSPSTICQGSSVQVGATVTGTSSAVTYTWSPNIGNGAGPYPVSPSASITYTVVVTDNCANQVSATVPVIVNPLPQASLAPQSGIGCDEVAFNFSDTLAANAAATHQWDFGDGYFAFGPSVSHAYAHSGNYNVSLTITSSQACSAVFNTQCSTVVYDPPSTQFATSATEVSILDPTISFYDQSYNAISWAWDFGDGNVSAAQYPSHTYASKGTYHVRLITYSTGGCSDTSSETIEVDPATTLFIPTAFTPNNDGKNDVFYAEGLEITEFHMSVFDRWGEQIFAADNMETGWDGRAKGGDTVAQIGVYVYKVRYKDFEGKENELLGHVSLVK